MYLCHLQISYLHYIHFFRGGKNGNFSGGEKKCFVTTFHRFSATQKSIVFSSLLLIKRLQMKTFAVEVRVHEIVHRTYVIITKMSEMILLGLDAMPRILHKPCRSWPGANPTILSYNASAVKIHNAANSLVRFENINMFFEVL
jgi:hypothetical protein